MTTETAIQPDATQEDQQQESKEQQQEQRSTPRMDAIEEIAERREEELRKEIGESVESLYTATQNAQIEPEHEPEPVKEEEPKYRVKIDGEEQEVPLSEILRGYQKDSAASRRLEDAARRQKELDEREERLREQEARLSNVPDTQEDEETATDTGAFLDALYEGDREKAEKLLKDLGIGRRTATQEQINPAEVAALVKQQIAVDGAFEMFKRDFQDVLGDPYLVKIADQFLDEARASGTPEAEAIIQAGNKTRDWVKQFAPAPAQSQDTSRADKLHRKEGMTRMPTANAARSGTQAPMDEETYRKSAIDDLMNQRRRGR